MALHVVTQLGATIGKDVPMWDQRDEFGATNHLVTTQEQEARLLAQLRLGPHSIVLMKRHGATVVGASISANWLSDRSIVAATPSCSFAGI